MNKTQHDWEWEVSRLVCQKMAQETLSLDVSESEISDALQSRVEALFASERAATRKRSIRRRVVTVLIAAVLLALTACMSIPAIRDKIVRIVVTYYEEFFSCQSEPAVTDDVTLPETEADPERATALPGVVMLGNTFEARFPTYLPEGYEVYRNGSTNQTTHIYYWNANSGAAIFYQQNPVCRKKYKINAENAQIQEVWINGNQGIAARKSAAGVVEITLVWNDGMYDYYLNTVLTLEETMKIAESIR